MHIYSLHTNQSTYIINSRSHTLPKTNENYMKNKYKSFVRTFSCIWRHSVQCSPHSTQTPNLIQFISYEIISVFVFLHGLWSRSHIERWTQRHIHTLHTHQKLRKVKQNPITTLERGLAHLKHIFCCLCCSKIKNFKLLF